MRRNIKSRSFLRSDSSEAKVNRSVGPSLGVSDELVHPTSLDIKREREGERDEGVSFECEA